MFLQVSHLPNSTVISWEVAFTPLSAKTLENQLKKQLPEESKLPDQSLEGQQQQQQQRKQRFEQQQLGTFLEMPPEIQQQLQQEQILQIQAFLPNPNPADSLKHHHQYHHYHKSSSSSSSSSSASTSSSSSGVGSGKGKQQEKGLKRQQEEEGEEEGGQGFEGAQLVFFKPGGLGFSAEELALLVKCMRAGNLSWEDSNKVGGGQCTKWGPRPTWGILRWVSNQRGKQSYVGAWEAKF